MSIDCLEAGRCAKCGSGSTEMYRAEKEANILLWYRCLDCGAEFVDVYEHTIKGLAGGDDE